MINISSIKMYMYCPMKLYLKTHVDISQNDEYQLYNEIKNLKIDIQDLLQKNMRKLNKTMNLNEIETALGQNIAAYTENNIDTIKNLKLGITQEQTDEIVDETYFNIKILALKAKKAMNILDKDGMEIVEMFFPNCMYSYLMKDKHLDLVGICDKIEIIDGKYYPISFKSSKPPLK